MAFPDGALPEAQSKEQGLVEALPLAQTRAYTTRRTQSFEGKNDYAATAVGGSGKWWHLSQPPMMLLTFHSLQ